MKSPQILLLQVMLVACAPGDILSSLSPFLGSSRPDYDPAAIEPDAAVQQPGYAPFSPADSDLGVQQVLGSTQGRAPVIVTLDTDVNFTDNAPNCDHSPDEDESWFFSSRLNVMWRPRLAAGWFADLGVSQAIVRFEADRALDFEDFDPYIGVVKSIPELDDLLVFSRYEYQRITTGSLTESDYGAQRIRTGLNKSLILAPRYQISGGLNAALDLTATSDSLVRNEYEANVTCTYWLADHLSSTFSWVGSMWDFRHNGREDWSHIVGVELAWTPCPNARVYTNVFYTNHDSNTHGGVDDFEAWQSGIGVGLNFTF